MSNSVKKTDNFSNLPIEIQYNVQKLILEKYDQNVEIGDLFHNNYYGVCKLVDIKVSNKDTDLSDVQLVFYELNDKEEENQKYHTAELYNCFSSYRKIETSVDTFYKQVDDLIKGNTSLDQLVKDEFGGTNSDTTELTIMNKDTVTHRRNEMIRQRNFTLSRYEQMKIILENKTRELYRFADDMKKQIEKANKLIIQLELYLGIQETMEQIQVGAPAKESDPICFRQRILYMDVECGDPSDDGLDFSSIDKFDNWLLSTHKYWNKKNYERLIPEEKCIAIFRVRKKDKEYYTGGNPFIDSMRNASLNEANKKTYIFIRNGENIYKIWSELINIQGKLFPSKDELQKLFENLNADRSWAKDEAQNQLFGYKLHVIFLQGILERTNIFQNSQEMSLFDPTIHESGKIEFIYDDDKSSLLPSHILPFGEWQHQLNLQIVEGNRIFFNEKRFKIICSGDGMYEYMINRRLFKEWFRDKDSMPNTPSKGIYKVEKVPINNKYNGKETLFFKYRPQKQWSYEEAKKGFSFAIEKDDEFIINYDAITLKGLDELEFYMYTSIGREEYLTYIPLLMELYKTRSEELKTENNFATLVLTQNNLDHTTENRNKVLDLIEWWKLKNKWKRSLTVDDTKALRMISKELNKEL